ncbi:MAG TPA: hypothetical protein PKE21_09445 [Flavobacteriales bacterium]|nr:hypothetical protein [Flavobacteriales bacterium]HMR27687.1 hypothetical protein [Flavobacteriales bacterium]
MTDPKTLLTVVDDWFHDQGFTQVDFKGPTERITTFHMGHTLVFKLHQRQGHATYYKEASGGSLIVFEVTDREGKVSYSGYCPLLLFGIWEQKLSFKADAGLLAPYRKEGFEAAQRFKRMLEEQ